MMMLPAAAFGDIVMTNVMEPIMDMFTGGNKGTEKRQDESERSSQSNQEEESGSKTSWRVSPPRSRRPKSRRDWWRALGQVQNQVRLTLEVLSDETSSAGRKEGEQEEEGEEERQSLQLFTLADQQCKPMS